MFTHSAVPDLSIIDRLTEMLRHPMALRQKLLMKQGQQLRVTAMEGLVWQHLKKAVFRFQLMR